MQEHRHVAPDNLRRTLFTCGRYPPFSAACQPKRAVSQRGMIPPFSGHSRETPNLAARLQSLAGANGVVVDAASRNLIRSMFNCVDFGLVTLKGSP